MSIVQDLQAAGQSIWLDYISRDLLDSGELNDYIGKNEIRGVTSNPTIFEQAIAKTNQYTEAITTGFYEGQSAEQVLDSLIVKDIRDATDLFLPLYNSTNGGDGFVSIEVNPELAHDAQGTLKEARRLWSSVDRPNTMIKIPATEEGILAIRDAIAEGININVTLIFALDRYSQVMEAYMGGLEQRLSEGEPIDHVASVASFFISRVDTAIDTALMEITEKEAGTNVADLFGKAAIANAKLAYDSFTKKFGSRRFEELAEKGARFQRPLWASTSTKNPQYPDTYYVDNLIGPHTVNTIPPKTFAAFKDHGSVARTIDKDLALSKDHIQKIEALGISMTEVTDQLEQDGVASFAKSFRNLFQTVQAQGLSLHQD